MGLEIGVHQYIPIFNDLGLEIYSFDGTAANLDVVQGDRLRIRAAATGTLANTVTFPAYMLRFSGTT